MQDWLVKVRVLTVADWRCCRTSCMRDCVGCDRLISE